MEDILPGPGQIYSCDQATLVSGSNILVSAGQIKKLEVSAWATIVIDGGTLIICGSVSTMNITLKNGGALLVNGSFAAYGTVNIPAGCRIVNNNGSVAFYAPLTVTGTLFNLHGSMATYSTLTNSGGNIINNSTFNNIGNGTTIPDNYDETTAGVYSVIWSNGYSHINTIKNLTAGTYTATITSGTCTTTKSYNIPAYSIPQVTVQKTDTSFCEGQLLAMPTAENDYYSYLWKKEGFDFAFTRGMSSLWPGNYELTATDLNGCTYTNNYSIVSNNTIYSNDSTIASTEHSSSASFEIDSALQIIYPNGANTTWDLSAIDFSLYTSQTDNDSIYYNPSIPSNKLNVDYRVSYGDSLSGTLPVNSWNIDGMDISKSGSYIIKNDASGTLKLPNGTFQVKRIHVVEKYRFDFLWDINETDTDLVVLDNYYWFSSNDTIHPILSYSTKNRIYDYYRDEFNEFIVGNNSNNGNSNIDEFKRLVNLRVTPNPATENINILYNLPENTTVKIFFDNSSSAPQHIIFNGAQLAGEHLLTYNVIDNFSGSYTVQLLLNNIAITQTVIISH